MVRLWPAVALLALLLPGCFYMDFDDDGDDFEDGGREREFFFWGPAWGFLLFAAIIAGIVVLVTNLSRPAPPPTAPAAMESTPEDVDGDDAGTDDPSATKPRPARRR